MQYGLLLESSYRQVKTFQRGPQLVLRSASPELACQEAWAHLVVHHCLIRIIMELAAGAGIDPDRISFLKVLKHVRRSVIARTVTTAAKVTPRSAISSSTSLQDRPYRRYQRTATAITAGGNRTPAKTEVVRRAVTQPVSSPEPSTNQQCHSAPPRQATARPDRGEVLGRRR